ncbi:MAG: hypothetical protein JKY30_02405 [Flavobacteriales bacterium]|nr:hypothetical protein [Flavobacteriales bacterium]
MIFESNYNNSEFSIYDNNEMNDKNSPFVAFHYKKRLEHYFIGINLMYKQEYLSFDMWDSYHGGGFSTHQGYSAYKYDNHYLNFSIDLSIQIGRLPIYLKLGPAIDYCIYSISDYYYHEQGSSMYGISYDREIIENNRLNKAKEIKISAFAEISVDISKNIFIRSQINTKSSSSHDIISTRDFYLGIGYQFIIVKKKGVQTKKKWLPYIKNK